VKEVYEGEKIPAHDRNCLLLIAQVVRKPANKEGCQDRRRPTLQRARSGGRGGGAHRVMVRSSTLSTSAINPARNSQLTTPRLLRLAQNSLRRNIPNWL